jgi:hypothetical protein
MTQDIHTEIWYGNESDILADISDCFFLSSTSKSLGEKQEGEQGLHRKDIHRLSSLCLWYMKLQIG